MVYVLIGHVTGSDLIDDRFELIVKSGKEFS